MGSNKALLKGKPEKMSYEMCCCLPATDREHKKGKKSSSVLLFCMEVHISMPQLGVKMNPVTLGEATFLLILYILPVAESMVSLESGLGWMLGESG